MDNGQGLRGIKNVDPEARVIIVSALDQRAVLKEAFKACASDFLVKPFDREVLLNTLNQLVA